MSKTNPLTRAKKKQAREMYMSGQLPQAKELYARICQLDIRDFEAWALLGAIQEQVGEFADAEASLRKALALNPTILDGYLTLGNTLLKQGRPDEAVVCYHEELRKRPNHPVAHNNLGSALVSSDRIEEGIASFRNAIRANPSYADAYSNLGNALIKAYRSSEATIDRQHSTAGNSGSTQACSNHAYTLQQQLLEEAKSCYLQVLRLNPSHTEARYALATLGSAPRPPTAPPEYVKTLFDSFAEGFDQHLVKALSYRAPELLNAMIRRAINPPAPPLDIADLGCGTGLCGILLRDLARTLVGIDLSPKMIDKARARHAYDDLQLADIVSYLDESRGRFDVLVCADVVIYIGDLMRLFQTAHGALRSDGLFALSAEASSEQEGQTYALRITGRYAHSLQYLRDLATTYGFTEISMDEVTLRMEVGKPVLGYVMVLRKSAETE